MSLLTSGSASQPFSSLFNSLRPLDPYFSRNSGLEVGALTDTQTFGRSDIQGQSDSQIRRSSETKLLRKTSSRAGVLPLTLLLIGGSGLMEDYALRDRQACEYEALEAMYSLDNSFSTDYPDALSLLRATLDSSAASQQLPEDPPLPLLSYKIGRTFPSQPSLDHLVKFELPKRYPDEPTTCRVEWDTCTRAELQSINAMLQQYADSFAGEESSLQMIEKCEELLQEVLRGKEQEEEEDALLQEETAQMLAAIEISKRTKIGRRLIYFHHIINETKRQCVVDWAVQLQLGGYSKIGWPGVVIVEGPETHCQEYVRCLQRLRWQQIVVRGEEIDEVPEGVDLDEMRKLPLGFEEFGTNGMSILAERCREAGAEELFLTAMKIYKNKDDCGEKHEGTTGKLKTGKKK